MMINLLERPFKSSQSYFCVQVRHKNLQFEKLHIEIR